VISLIFLFILLLLLCLNAALVACEVSLVKLRYSLAEDDVALSVIKRMWPVRFLIDNGEWTAQVIRFGIMVNTLGAGLCLLPWAMQVREQLGVASSKGSDFLLVLLALLVSGSILSLFGFLLPRGYALMQPQRSLRCVAWVVALLVLVAYPWFGLQRVVAHRLFRLLGIRFRKDFNFLDVEVQIRALSEDEPEISPQARRIIQNAIRLRELEASDVVLPRHQVQIMDLGESVQKNLEMARLTGHTRFPLCHEDLDNCVGLVHIKDIFRYRGPLVELRLEAIQRPILSFVENRNLESVFTELLAQKAHMGLVIDDFGGVIGILTLESIIESLVGAIHDEFDSPEAQRITAISPTEYKVDGLTPVHELEEALNVNIETTEASTFGGVVMEQLGRLPEAGETVELVESGLEVVVKKVDAKRILSATVKHMPPAADAE